jgi:hypothetical protein
LFDRPADAKSPGKLAETFAFFGHDETLDGFFHWDATGASLPSPGKSSYRNMAFCPELTSKIVP